jgi:phosphoglucomutase
MVVSGGVMQRYEAWLNDPGIDAETKRELEAIRGQESEIEDRFYRDLEFGTGGLRGVIGAGTNRMNRYTVGIASQGLAQHLLASAGEAGGGKAPSCVIAHDSRRFSPEFALEAALVLAANGVRAYVFEGLRPTPELSFAVRELGASAGIVITASHNPPEYNGYKVYGPDGGQLVVRDAERVLAEIRKLPGLAAVKRISREEAERSGLLQWIGEAMDRRYIEEVTAVSMSGGGSMKQALRDIRILYTPLHGSGNRLVRMALDAIGAEQVRVVPEQELPDGNFPTVKSPNPEERSAFQLAIAQGEAWGADIIIGTDPDADRMGAVVRHNGDYHILTGNQSGALMIHYVCTRLQEFGRLPANGVVIKTIVTSEMGAEIAKSFGLQVMNTLTGFKYIGEKMTSFARSGSHTFVFGYEESYGYLAGMYARDKDAVLASMLICEAAAYYKQQGKTLIDVLEELYGRFGYFKEHLESRTLKGKEGMERIRAIMEDWRSAQPERIGGGRVARVLDYSTGIDDLPLENVLKFILEDGSWFCIRPSGTEPKIKCYFAVCGTSHADADDKLSRLTKEVMARI